MKFVKYIPNSASWSTDIVFRIVFDLDIFSISASLFDLDTDELDRLEIELAAAQQALEDADLDSQFTKLTTTNNQVKKWVADYRLDISDLEADVENVREIMESLPTGCFKNIEIETPTAQ